MPTFSNQHTSLQKAKEAPEKAVERANGDQVQVVMAFVAFGELGCELVNRVRLKILTCMLPPL